MKVAVTGATGFIGTHLLPSLVSHGYQVVALSEPETWVHMEGVENFHIDVISGKGLKEGLVGVDGVIHLAARNHIIKDIAKDPLTEYRKVNVEGTRNVIRASADSLAKVFIHLSSVKAMKEESVRALDENDPCVPKTPYGISKLESEEVVGEVASTSGMHATILRLPMVYGPYNRGNLPRMIRWAKRGLPFPLFQPDNLRSMAYVENVVAGILAVLKSSPMGVSTFILKDKEDYSTRKVYSAICHELGKKPRFLWIPAAMTKLGGILSEDFRKVTGSFRVSSAKFEMEIGFIPPIHSEEGIARTVRWYLDSER